MSAGPPRPTDCCSLPMRDEEFERLYAAHADSLLAFLVYRTGDRALAEDLLADTFERVLRSGWRFDRRKASEKTWIYSIALNCLRGHHRRRRAEERAVVRAAPAEGGLWTDPIDDRDAVNRALAVLSDEERESIALRFGAELTVPEIAKLLGQPLTTVEGRVYGSNCASSGRPSSRCGRPPRGTSCGSGWRLPALVAAALLAGAAGVFLVMALGFALALALRIQQPDERQLVARLADGALLAIPGALVVVFAFNGGGFFPQAPAVVAVALSGVLVARVLFARDPFEGFGPLLVTAAAALFLYCGWCLLSLTWSHAPGRAFVESDRALLYVLVVVLFGSIARDSRRIAWAVRGAVLGIVVVCTCALITRVLPDVWPIGPNIYENRLAYPITYWNTLGLLAAIGCVLALHLTCSLREAAWMRVAAAASIPVLATTLLFTFSRGAIGAGIIGLAAYILLGRSRGLIGGLLATVPPTAIALVAAYRADLLATNTPTTAAATAQGHRVALLVAVCVACAAVLRAVCLRLDDRVERVRLAPATTRAVRTGLAATVLAALVFLLAAGAPHWIGSQYHRFLSTKAPDAGGKTTRQRLTDPSNNGRLANWKVALREFRGSALHGDGAGTYALAWAIHRPADFGPYQVVTTAV